MSTKRRDIQDARERSWWWMDNKTVDEGWMIRLGVHAWAVYCVLVRHSDRQGQSFPSAAEISSISGVSTSEVRRSLKLLLGLKLIQRVKRGTSRTPTIYQVRSLPASKSVEAEKTKRAPKSAKVSTPEQAKLDATALLLASLDQADEPEPEPAPVKKRGATRRCPKDWEPVDQHREIAKIEGVDFDRELAMFRDHTFGTARVDWDATFRNWLRSARSISRAHYGSKGKEIDAASKLQQFYETEELV